MPIRPFNLCTAFLCCLFVLIAFSSCNKDDSNNEIEDEIPNAPYFELTLNAADGSSFVSDIEENETFIDIESNTSIKKAGWYYQNDTVNVYAFDVVGNDTLVFQTFAISTGALAVQNYPIVPLNLFTDSLANGEASAIAYHTGLPEELLFFYLFGSEPTSGSNFEITDYNADSQLLSGNFNFGFEGADTTGVVQEIFNCSGSFSNLSYSEYTP